MFIIVINHKSIIGKNCNLSQGVTIGRTFRGNKKGVPIIGDNVFIGPGAVIIGNINVGNNVAVGANCVVLKDVPDHAVVVGVPGTILHDAMDLACVRPQQSCRCGQSRKGTRRRPCSL